MFGKNNTDDFDDYKREQSEIKREKKDTSSHKAPKINKKTNTNGNLVYHKSTSAETTIILCLILIFPIVIAAMMVTTGETSIKSASSEMLVPIGFFLFFFLIFYFAIYGFAPKAKQIELADNALVCKMAFNKKIEIPYNYFIEIECKRTYGKNHQYTGTRYYVVYEDPSDSRGRKVLFPSSKALDVSDFNFEVQKRVLFTNGKTENENIPYNFSDSQQFFIPQSKNMSAERMRFIVIFPTVAILMILFAFGSSVSKTGINSTEIPVVAFFFIFLIALIAIASLKFSKRKWDTLPETITFEQSCIRIDEKFFRSSEVKRIYITPIGRNNPRAFDNSTIDIITQDARYSYNLGVFFHSRKYILNNMSIVPDWDFAAFYFCARKWCETNNIDLVDFLI